MILVNTCLAVLAKIAQKVVPGATAIHTAMSAGTMTGPSQTMSAPAPQGRPVGTERIVSLVIQTNIGAPLFADAEIAPLIAMSALILKYAQNVNPHMN